MLFTFSASGSKKSTVPARTYPFIIFRVHKMCHRLTVVRLRRLSCQPRPLGTRRDGWHRWLLIILSTWCQKTFCFFGAFKKNPEDHNAQQQRSEKEGSSLVRVTNFLLTSILNNVGTNY
jgi:hypothetical protein